MVVPGHEPHLVAASEFVPPPGGTNSEALQRGSRPVHFDGEWMETPVLRGEPPRGTRAEGPVVFELPEATLVLPPRWRAEVDEAGTIRAEVER
jgi:N-methylhydantoinase A/oxoprolinase/acetone carboxylase beta subunit